MSNPCKNNAACVSNDDGSVTCRCRQEKECPKDGQALCGSDGQSYLNKCFLDVAACKNNKNVDLKHEGPCGKLWSLLCLFCFVLFCLKERAFPN